jgi:hypothetical protein
VKKSTLILIITSLGLITCKKDHMLDCFKSAGKSVTETRDASSFVNINLQNNVDLVIVPNSTPYIKVTAGENLIDGIITELSGNTLYIRNENRCNWMRSFSNTYTVEVGMSNPDKIDYYGSGNIRCVDWIQSDEFTFDCWNGSGTIELLFKSNKVHVNNNIGRADFKLKGSCAVSYIYMNDVATINAENLSSGYTFITNRSTGDARINVNKELSAEIDYIGNIYYTGKPYLVNKTITNEGLLIEF